MIIVTNKMTPTTEKMATKRFDFPDLYIRRLGRL